MSNTSHFTANVTIFSPSSFFIMVHTGMGLQLQVQLVPIMQVFVRLDPSYHGQMCGEAPVDLRAGPWGGGAAGGQVCPSCRIPNRRGSGSIGSRAPPRSQHHPAHLTSNQ